VLSLYSKACQHKNITIACSATGKLDALPASTCSESFRCIAKHHATELHLCPGHCMHDHAMGRYASFATRSNALSTPSGATLRAMLLFISLSAFSVNAFQNGRSNYMIVFVVNIAFCWKSIICNKALKCLTSYYCFQISEVLARLRNV
jgi:hypothetical protein